MDDYELQELFEADPMGVTARVVAEASAEAAAQVAQIHHERQSEQDSRVLNGQIESASIQAKEGLDRRYGKAEVDWLMPAIGERLQNSPHLLSEEMLTSPRALASAMD